MATVTARKVDDDDYEILTKIAEENGRSISEELRLLIAELVRNRRAKQTAEGLRALRDRVNWTLPTGKTSLDLLRDERDSW